MRPLNLNLELIVRECACKAPPLGGDEKAALRRADEAERAFRVSKGYEKDTLWNRIKACMRA